MTSCRRDPTAVRGWGGLAVLLLIAGCASPFAVINQPLRMDAGGRPDFDSNYGLGPYVERIARGQLTSVDAAGSDVLLFVTISGGG